ISFLRDGSRWKYRASPVGAYQDRPNTTEHFRTVDALGKRQWLEQRLGHSQLPVRRRAVRPCGWQPAATHRCSDTARWTVRRALVPRLGRQLGLADGV